MSRTISYKTDGLGNDTGGATENTGGGAVRRPGTFRGSAFTCYGSWIKSLNRIIEPELEVHKYYYTHTVTYTNFNQNFIFHGPEDYNRCPMLKVQQQKKVVSQICALAHTVHLTFNACASCQQWPISPDFFVTLAVAGMHRCHHPRHRHRLAVGHRFHPNIRERHSY